MRPTERHALIVTYYADVKARLIAEALLPAADRAAVRPGVELAYLRRHWKRGPHVRLVLRGDPAACHAALRDAGTEVGAYLRAHPSTAPLDAAAYLLTSERLGLAELELGPYGPVRPDNSVDLSTVDIADGLLEAGAARVREELLHAARPALAATLQGGGRLEAAYRLMVMVAATYPKGLRQGFLAFLSHVEEFLLWNDPKGSISTGFAAGLETQRARLLPIMRQLAADHTVHPTEPGHYTGADPLLTAWGRVIGLSWASGLALAAAGDLHPYPDPKRLLRAERFGADAVRQWAGRDDRPYSAFHTTLRQLNLPAAGMGAQFSAYRLLCNVLYELLPLLDVAPIERYFLGYCLAHLTQELVGDTAERMVGRVVAAQAAAGLLPDGGQR